jgi:hypothetical protein
MDIGVSPGWGAFLGNRRSPGTKQDRHILAGRVDEPADRIGGADIDMHHHRLRPAGRQIGAMRHSHRQVLMRHGDRLRQIVEAAMRCVSLDDRRKIGAGITE